MSAAAASTRIASLVGAALLVPACSPGDQGAPGQPDGAPGSDASAEADASSEPDLTPSEPLPVVSGSFEGRYLVPASPALAAAATYPIVDVDWSVVGGIATLDYDLPVGLVGGEIEVVLSGTLADGATSVDLAGPVGTGRCVATATTVTCREAFSGLGTLPISMAVVRQVAAVEYAGPVGDREAVANVFADDPIGFVVIDLLAPHDDDDDDDDG